MHSNLFGWLGRLASSDRLGSTAWSVVSVVYGGLVFYFAATLFESQSRYAVLFVGASVIVVALSFSLKGKSFYDVLGKTGNKVVVAAIIILAIAATVYVYSQYQELTVARAAVKSVLDHIIGIILLVMVLETSRKAMGPVIPLLVVVLWLYAYFGPFFPGDLGHRGLGLLKIIDVSSINLDAIFGSLTGIVGTIVAAFVFYGGFIQAFGGMELVFKLGRFLGKKSEGLIPQSAIVASMFFGMVSGSAVANVAAIGPFTIPLMKRHGITPRLAAAVESCASTGGQVMPPVMASAVFVMMDYIHRSYLDIMIIGLAPALIYYASLALGVHSIFRAKFLGEGKQTALKETVTSATSSGMGKSSFLKVIPIVISMVVLFVLLGLFEFAVLTSAFYTVLSYLGTAFVIQMVVSKGRLSGLVSFFKCLVQGFSEGSATVATIGVLVACMGIVVKILAVTTLAQKISFAMVDIGGDNRLALYLMIMVVCLIFGLVMSSLAAYILVAMLGAPAMLTLGVNPIVAHFFVFYLAILAAITPPVAPACLVAAKISGANYMRVCLESMKLGVSLFVLPFVFLAYPALLVHSFPETPVAIVLSALAMFSLTLGLCLPLAERLAVPRKLAYLCFGVLLILHPGTIVTVVVGVLAMGAIFFEVRTSGWLLSRGSLTPISPPKC